MYFAVRDFRAWKKLSVQALRLLNSFLQELEAAIVSVSRGGC